MSKWTKVKAAMLAATTVVSALQLGGCLGGIWKWDQIIKLVAVGSIFD